MSDPAVLNQERVAKYRSATGAQSAVGDERLPVDRHPNENRWLHSRVEELERQLRLRTIVLGGALALSAILGSSMVASCYQSGRPTVALAPSSETRGSLRSVTWMGEQSSQIERSQAWTMGEEQIEAMAVLHFDPQRTQAPTEQVTTWPEPRGAEAMEPEASARNEIRGEGSEAVTRNWTPMSPEMSVSFNQDEGRAARANEQAQYKANDFVNLRAAPNNSAEVLTVVAEGDLVRRTGHNLGWLQVEYSGPSASSLRGWVYGNYLRRVGTSGELARPWMPPAALSVRAISSAGRPRRRGSVAKGCGLSFAPALHPRCDVQEACRIPTLAM